MRRSGFKSHYISLHLIASHYISLHLITLLHEITFTLKSFSVMLQCISVESGLSLPFLFRKSDFVHEGSWAASARNEAHLKMCSASWFSQDVLNAVERPLSLCPFCRRGAQPGFGPKPRVLPRARPPPCPGDPPDPTACPAAPPPAGPGRAQTQLHPQPGLQPPPHPELSLDRVQPGRALPETKEEEPLQLQQPGQVNAEVPRLV